MAFLKYLLTPKLYLEYGTQQAISYEPLALDKFGQQIISFVSFKRTQTCHFAKFTMAQFSAQYHVEHWLLL